MREMISQARSIGSSGSFVLLAVVLAVIGASPAAGTKPGAAAKLPPDQLREANKLLTEFRAAGADADRRREVCDQVLAIGPGAAPLMAAAIEKELRPLMRRYSTKFQQQAALVAKKKTVKIDLNEVVQLRRTVLSLQKRGDGFTKEVIVQEGDPAMKRLHELIIIDRAAILDPSADLQAERKKVEELGSLWQRCQSQMPKPAAEEGQEPPKPFVFDDYLQGEEGLAAALATPMDAKTRTILAANARMAEKLDPEEARTILACNLMRNLLGLSAVVIDFKLCESCRDHSKDMETKKFFAHESPVPGKTTPWDRAKRCGTTACAENISMGYHDGNAANQGWFHSPGHHKNMLLSDVLRIGVGRSGGYYTEAFGR